MATKPPQNLSVYVIEFSTRISTFDGRDKIHKILCPAMEQTPKRTENWEGQSSIDWSDHDRDTPNFGREMVAKGPFSGSISFRHTQFTHILWVSYGKIDNFMPWLLVIYPIFANPTIQCEAFGQQKPMAFWNPSVSQQSAFLVRWTPCLCWLCISCLLTPSFLSLLNLHFLVVQSPLFTS